MKKPFDSVQISQALEELSIGGIRMGVLEWETPDGHICLIGYSVSGRYRPGSAEEPPESPEVEIDWVISASGEEIPYDRWPAIGFTEAVRLRLEGEVLERHADPWEKEYSREEELGL